MSNDEWIDSCPHLNLFSQRKVQLPANVHKLLPVGSMPYVGMMSVKEMPGVEFDFCIDCQRFIYDDQAFQWTSGIRRYLKERGLL